MAILLNSSDIYGELYNAELLFISLIFVVYPQSAHYKNYINKK
ncbi:4501_t:CDS:1, partial [Funneliformis geosporum]